MYPELQLTVDGIANSGKTISTERAERLGAIAAWIKAQCAKGNTAHLAFICTNNSRRSQFAQVWAKVAAHRTGLKDIHQKRKAALLVVEQVFAPAKVLVVAGLHAHAVLEAHHLPVHALQLALGAQRNDGAYRLVLLGRAQLAAHAAAQGDDAGARAAGDAFGGA